MWDKAPEMRNKVVGLNPEPFRLTLEPCDAGGKRASTKAAIQKSLGKLVISSTEMLNIGETKPKVLVASELEVWMSFELGWRMSCEERGVAVFALGLDYADGEVASIGLSDGCEKHLILPLRLWQDRSGTKTPAEWLAKYALGVRSILFNDAMTIVGAHVNELQQLLLPTDRWEDVAYVMDMVRLCATEYTSLFDNLDRSGKSYTEELGVQLGIWAHLGSQTGPISEQAWRNSGRDGDRPDHRRNRVVNNFPTGRNADFSDTSLRFLCEKMITTGLITWKRLREFINSMESRKDERELCEVVRVVFQRVYKVTNSTRLAWSDETSTPRPSRERSSRDDSSRRFSSRDDSSRRHSREDEERGTREDERRGRSRQCPCIRFRQPYSQRQRPCVSRADFGTPTGGDRREDRLGKTPRIQRHQSRQGLDDLWPLWSVRTPRRNRMRHRASQGRSQRQEGDDPMRVLSIKDALCGRLSVPLRTVRQVQAHWTRNTGMSLTDRKRMVHHVPRCGAYGTRHPSQRQRTHPRPLWIWCLAEDHPRQGGTELPLQQEEGSGVDPEKAR